MLFSQMGEISENVSNFFLLLRKTCQLIQTFSPVLLPYSHKSEHAVSWATSRSKARELEHIHCQNLHLEMFVDNLKSVVPQHVIFIMLTIYGQIMGGIQQGM